MRRDTSQSAASLHDNTASAPSAHTALLEMKTSRLMGHIMAVDRWKAACVLLPGNEGTACCQIRGGHEQETEVCHKQAAKFQQKTQQNKETKAAKCKN